MGLWPLYIFHSYSVWIDFRRQRQTKVDPRKLLHYLPFIYHLVGKIYNTILPTLLLSSTLEKLSAQLPFNGPSRHSHVVL